jgi:hypothetical protein
MDKRSQGGLVLEEKTLYALAARKLAVVLDPKQNYPSSVLGVEVCK